MRFSTLYSVKLHRFSHSSWRSSLRYTQTLRKRAFIQDFSSVKADVSVVIMPVCRGALQLPIHTSLCTWIDTGEELVDSLRAEPCVTPPLPSVLSVYCMQNLSNSRSAHFPPQQPSQVSCGGLNQLQQFQVVPFCLLKKISSFQPVKSSHKLQIRTAVV